VFVPWFETQKGLVAENDIPHGFRRLGSVTGASPETLETKFAWVNASGSAFREKRNTAEKRRRDCLERRIREDMTVNFRG